MCVFFYGWSGPPARECLCMDVPKHYINILYQCPTVQLTSVGFAQAHSNNYTPAEAIFHINFANPFI